MTHQEAWIFAPCVEAAQFGAASTKLLSGVAVELKHGSSVKQ
jgi:hypothetical protein